MRGLSCAVRAFAVLCMLLGVVLQARADSLDWLAYDDAAKEAYGIEVPADRPWVNVATPAQGEGGASEGTAHEVMLLIPKRSVSAYSQAVNTILSAFDRRGVRARFTIWYYASDKENAKAALAWAYDQPVELIMSVGSAATAFLHEHHRGHSIPAVSSASKDPVAIGQMADFENGSGTNMAYTSINVPMDVIVAYLRQLQPDLDTILVLWSEDNTSARLSQVKPLHAVAEERQGLRVIDVTVRSEETADADLEANLTAALQQAGAGEDAAQTAVVLLTGSTPVYERTALIERLVGRIPIVATLPDVVREGDDSALLSIGVDMSNAVTRAAVYGIDVLTGAKSVGDLPVGVVTPPDVAISFRKARQIGHTVPFSFFESATFVYDYEGRRVVSFGKRVTAAAD